MRDREWATRVSADAIDRRVASEGRTHWTAADREAAERLRAELLDRTDTEGNVTMLARDLRGSA